MSRVKQLEAYDPPKGTRELAERRVDLFLTREGLKDASYNLRELMVWAYLQGITDTIEAIKKPAS